MADRILGLVCLILAAGMGWLGRGYVAPISYEPVGPAAFPLLLAGLMAVLGGWLAVRPQPQVDGAEPAEPLWGPASIRVLTLAAVMLAYAVLFQWLGFVIATALMTLPVGRVFGGTWRQCAVAGVALGVSFFLLFDRVFDVILPAGLLSVLG
ncbi:tripartite tricarboxylate transporter TctB family protein [uncultured Aquabacterium sp.]|jgi:putative tricarboxylic transport membrane protein|uniref:tripartite tricarboxylate transporter TctB family protein n=1 Tax=uncultured Aquabacterium sp. TaxID=158753 RepID=UPI00260FFA8F|nr:tripartite tricarboxylate transporter TctB family protein [uncultured Aquabacterium sp.]